MRHRRDSLQLDPEFPLGNGPMRRVSAAALDAENPVEYESQVHVSGPAITLVQSQRDAVAAIDLGEQPGVQAVQDVAAEHAGILHGGIQKALPGPAATYHKIDPLQIEQDGSHQARMDVRQLRLGSGLDHAGVDDFVLPAFQSAKNVRVAIRGAVFVDYRYSHLYLPFARPLEVAAILRSEASAARKTAPAANSSLVARRFSGLCSPMPS